MMKKDHPMTGEFIALLDTAKIGADLLQQWGLPDRICRAVELQRYPHFAAPDLINPIFSKALLSCTWHTFSKNCWAEKFSLQRRQFILLST